MINKKILVLAYTISPYRGSEYSVSWNYVSRMSLENELIVLYGASGDNMGDTDELEQYLRINPVLNVQFIPIRPTKFTKVLNLLNRKGILRYTFYLAYRVWHRTAFKVAKKLVESEDFDLVHFLNPIGYREPGLLWKLNLPYIWGPIGGANNVPIQLFKALEIKDKLKFTFRLIVNSFQLRWNVRFRKALDKTNLLLTATKENQIKIEEIHNKKSLYLPENAIHRTFNFEKAEEKPIEKIHFVWIGSINGGKALIILLDSLLLVKDRSKIIIDIIGDGPLKKSLMNYARKNGLEDNLIWHGNITRNNVYEILSKAKLNIITSLSEGNPTTIWEAMSLGVPTITLDHCGMHDTICDSCGIRIKIGRYDQVVSDFAKELYRLSQNVSELNELSIGANSCSLKFSWTSRAKLFNEYYDLAIENWRNQGVKS